MSLWLASQLHFFSQASVALLRGHTRDTRTKQMCTHEWEWVSRALTVDQERLAEISSNARNTWQMKDYQRDNSNKHDVLCKNKHPPPQSLQGENQGWRRWWPGAAPGHTIAHQAAERHNAHLSVPGKWIILHLKTHWSLLLLPLKGF